MRVRSSIKGGRHSKDTAIDGVYFDTAFRVWGRALPVDSYAYQHKTGEVEAEGPCEHHEAAHDVAGQPLHRTRPRDLQRHHQECHLRKSKHITAEQNIQTKARYLLRTEQRTDNLTKKVGKDDEPKVTQRSLYGYYTRVPIAFVIQ